MNKPLALEIKFLYHKDPAGEHGGSSFTGDIEGRLQKKTLGMGASLLRGPLENPVSPLIGNFKTYLEGPEGEHLSLRNSVRGPLSGDLEAYGD
jgi:hypothetical protein